MSSIRCIQVNLHHAKGASAVLCRRFTKERLNIALIQEPWINHNTVLGLSTKNSKMIYCNTQPDPRTVILLSKVIKFTPITEFIQRDIVAITVEVPTPRGTQEMVVASAYFPGNQEDIPPPETAALERYCRRINKPFLIGCDANAHHTVWSSTNINKRGECLLEYLSSHDVNVCNEGNKPTFINAVRQEVLDLTLCSTTMSEKIKNWHVSDETSLSDHRHIIFDIEANKLQTEKYRVPSRTNWDGFREHLMRTRSSNCIKIRTPSELENEVENIQARITDAYNANCPLIERKVCRDVPWWNKNLEQLRKESRRMFNQAKNTQNWEAYRAALTKYNAELRKAKSESKRRFCEGIQTMPEAIRLQKALEKDHTNGLGQLRKEDGCLTVTKKETLDVLMNIHFPGSTEKESTTRPANFNARRRVSRESTQLARRMFTHASISWALSTFEPMKSPGPDGILPMFLQKADDIIMTELISIFRSSYIFGHIPENWRKVKAIFIPKAGKKDRTMPKAFRPISLTSTFLKVMEKITDNYIRTVHLKNAPLHKHQHAYQTGKSTESALHHLVTLIEKSQRFQETVLCAFLDIEGAFDNTSYTSIKTALLNRGVDETTTNWIESMLISREISASLGDTSIVITASKGCPQGGVLSPLLWSLVVDVLLQNLTQLGYEVIGYADDVVLIIRSKCDATLSSRLQSALNHTSYWCTKEGLSINPSKTVIIPFTNRRKHNIVSPTMKGERLNFSTEVKYLGVILDRKLNWNPHLDYAVKKATTAIWACGKLFGKTWGLSPKLALWSYTTIARPRITYASLVWWPKVNEKTAQAKLNKVQRLACLTATSAMRTTPTAAMEAMLHILPLHLYVKKEAELGALRQQRNKNNLEGDLIGHLRILKEFSITPLVTTVSDCMQKLPNMDIPYKTIETNRQMWARGGPVVPLGTICFFTDGSKMGRHTGSGVYGPGIRKSISMGQWPTVFQAEVYAIYICANVCLNRNYRHAKIGIFSDSQAALLALKSATVDSKLVWECIEVLRELSRKNKVMLFWVPGHCGVEGNEIADSLAREGSSGNFVGPEPFLGTSKSAIKHEVALWENTQILSQWRQTQGCRQAKSFITPNSAITNKLMNLKRKELRMITGLLTGHCPAKYHLKKIGRVPSDICRFCNTEPESSAHLLCYCGALVLRRLKFFGSHLLSPCDIWRTHPRKVLSFIECIVPDWEGTGLQTINSSPSSMGTSHL